MGWWRVERLSTRGLCAPSDDKSQDVQRGREAMGLSRVGMRETMLGYVVTPRRVGAALRLSPRVARG